MTALVLCVMLMGQPLAVDSIMDPGGWTDPVNIFTSDNLYATTASQNDHMILGIADPTDTTGTLDSVYVYLEQYVSAANGLWNVTPIINGVPGTQTPDVAGTLADSTLGFNVTGDITGWADLFDFQIDLGVAKGGGATPNWFADYLYVYLYVSGADVDEEEARIGSDFVLSVPSLGNSTLRFAYTLNDATPVSIEVFNISGARVVQARLSGQSGSNTATISIDDLGHGVYFLKASTGYGTQTAKFVVLN